MVMAGRGLMRSRSTALLLRNRALCEVRRFGWREEEQVCDGWASFLVLGTYICVPVRTACYGVGSDHFFLSLPCVIRWVGPSKPHFLVNHCIMGYMGRYGRSLLYYGTSFSVEELLIYTQRQLSHRSFVFSINHWGVHDLPNNVGLENTYLVNVIIKPTNSPTQGQPNPRKIRFKV